MGVEWKSDTSARDILHGHFNWLQLSNQPRKEVRSDLEELTRASIGWVESWRRAEPRFGVVCIVYQASPERAKH